MKYVIVIALFCMGCGQINNLCKNNEESVGVFCNDVVGYDFNQKEEQGRLNKGLEARVQMIEGQIKFLNIFMNNSKKTMNDLYVNIQNILLAIDDNAVSMNQMWEAYNSLVLITNNLQNDYLSNINNIGDLYALINDLKNAINTNTLNINLINQAINALTMNTNNSLNNLSNDLSNTNDQLTNNFDGLIDILQNQINENTQKIAQLQGYNNIVSIINPCGDDPLKYDEIFLRLSSGKIIASFSDNKNGLNTRFSELKIGNYMTTDGTSCVFEVKEVNNRLEVISKNNAQTLEY